MSEAEGAIKLSPISPTHLLFRDSFYGWNKIRGIQFSNTQYNLNDRHFVIRPLLHSPFFFTIKKDLVAWNENEYDYFAVYQSDERLDDWKIMTSFPFSEAAVLASNIFYTVYGFRRISSGGKFMSKEVLPFPENFCHFIPSSQEIYNGLQKLSNKSLDKDTIEYLKSLTFSV